LATRPPDRLATARDHFLSLHPADLTLSDFVTTLTAIEIRQHTIAQFSGTALVPIFQGCAPSPCTYSDSSAAVAETAAAAAATAAAAAAVQYRPGKDLHPKGRRGGGRGEGVEAVVAVVCQRVVLTRGPGLVPRSSSHSISSSSSSSSSSGSSRSRSGHWVASPRDGLAPVEVVAEVAVRAAQCRVVALVSGPASTSFRPVLAAAPCAVRSDTLPLVVFVAWTTCSAFASAPSRTSPTGTACSAITCRFSTWIWIRLVLPCTIISRI
ncbi:hypothetical protein CLOM_g24383, partial [Closterium sp. NIES-68]